MAIQVNNVITGQKEKLETIKENQVGIYVCGVTVYGRCHVGHLRSCLSFDAILRHLAYRNYDVKFVRNFTDIDDKIIARANEITAGPDGEWRNKPAYADYDQAQWEERLEEDAQILSRADGQERHLAEVVSDHFIDVFNNEDFGPFDLFKPYKEPRVSQMIPQVVELIERIIANGFAYEVQGDVYFDVPSYHEATKQYGKLSGRDYQQMMDGARIATTDKKKSAPDFALWKKSAEGDPAWDSPWGEGRPGWHIECSAMSMDILGETFDIHGGGKDLIFPHHENEIAQSEAATKKNFCNTWIHNGFVTVDGVKMSKSLGNFVTIKDALEIAPPEVWRLLILGTHYANPIDLSRTREVEGQESTEMVRGSIEIAFDRLEYFYETLKRASQVVDQEIPDGTGVLEDSPAILENFGKAMDDDFNTAKALADLGEGMKYINELCDMKAKKIKKLEGGRISWMATIKKVSRELEEGFKVLALCNKEPSEALIQLRDFSMKRRGLSFEAIDEKLNERKRAREEKQWARSDEVRDELIEMGVELRDTPAGTEWKIIR